MRVVAAGPGPSIASLAQLSTSLSPRMSPPSPLSPGPRNFTLAVWNRHKMSCRAEPMRGQVGPSWPMRGPSLQTGRDCMIMCDVEPNTGTGAQHSYFHLLQYSANSASWKYSTLDNLQNWQSFPSWLWRQTLCRAASGSIQVSEYNIMIWEFF